MRTTRTAAYAVLFLLTTAMLAAGDSAPKNAGLPTSPRQVTPLLIGERIPEATLKSAAGELFQLRELTQRAPTLLIFYRGKW
jgi:hypothetical protein